ncbi:phosphatidylinositol-3-phosphate binding protein Ecym_8168 [Eremothecium cymbalariae DBVPG|uniref:FYVE-type domain-containing protein n=1 Tax=Eremothecium cymbalariae (strain CBS 270.75 / DBVPG 7215 / KCTC 17166 / NRRL Y-17582) TaxID=931890 RepID=G8JX80_ERECY|nr:Hypothetical protein Ecym_8168 [Eremothecium cymbalariae DBVPG\
MASNVPVGRVIGRDSPTKIKEIDETLECPVCGSKVKGLDSLNTHLDVEHGFNYDRTNSTDSSSVNLTSVDQRVSSRQKSGSTITLNTVPHVDKGHWKTPTAGKSRCFKCQKKLTPKIGMRNCRKCGELFCYNHCGLLIKLNSAAHYDPIVGEWFKCCSRCMQERPGYNDFGLYVDLTETFLKQRTIRNEDKQLQIIQLENRLVRLVDGIIDLNAYHKSTFFSTKLSNDINNLEKTITPWRKNESTNQCTICTRYFHLLLRKHHCRLCGKLVCDDNLTYCSTELLIQDLIKAAPDLPFKKPNYDISLIKNTLRICSSCIDSFFLKRKFQQDLMLESSSLFSKYTELQSVSRVILRIMPRFERLLGTVNSNKPQLDKSGINELAILRRRLLEAFTLYEKLAKQVLHLQPDNEAERKIQRSIQIKALAFIQEKMLPLKKIPEVLNPSNPVTEIQTSPSKLLFNNLTIGEVKQYREQLMVLKEQKYIVEGLVEDAKKQRKFEEIPTLKQNINEIAKKIEDVEGTLGDQGFE